ncbi:hypothetical protein QLX67_12675 [Balneolaceae bacterium ANBcel3]|nr:hypothetical protein [Balneolaceae bacterium ANBcel3]
MVSTKHLRFLGNLTVVMLLAFTVACGPSLTLTDVDYSQPMESVASPDQNGMVNYIGTGISFDVTPLNVKERGEGAALPEKVRIIRNRDGYYFVTAPGYRNVYVFTPEERALKMEERIRVSDAGLANPAFNQQGTHIQLIDGNTELRLSKSGIVN